jgi:hypothetical protein
VPSRRLDPVAGPARTAPPLRPSQAGPATTRLPSTTVFPVPASSPRGATPPTPGHKQLNDAFILDLRCFWVVHNNVYAMSSQTKGKLVMLYASGEGLGREHARWNVRDSITSKESRNLMETSSQISSTVIQAQWRM